ncbi:MAG: hypothetical protein ACOYXO_08260, partial [Chloroflexota bacterium]
TKRKAKFRRKHHLLSTDFHVARGKNDKIIEKNNVQFNTQMSDKKSILAARLTGNGLRPA